MATKKVSSKNNYSLPIGIVLVIVFFVILVIGIFVKKQAAIAVDSYDKCVKINGSQVTAMYPGQCTTPDGKTFTQPLSEEEKKDLLPPVDVEEETWEEAKEDFEDCEVVQATELHDGTLRYREDDREEKLVKEYDVDELYQFVQNSEADCDFQIDIALE